MHKYNNRLVREKSPYLLQHAHNPVDWYPWSEEAFSAAKEENKPVFLSIGYATCHWCHVMEHESFENEQVAALMNDAFINIKVDREEYPALDNVYMKVCMMFTGSGGWPMTIIMTPDKKPFFAGTYIPRESAFGRVGMLELIPGIKEVWINKRQDIEVSAETVSLELKRNFEAVQTAEVNTELLPDQAFEELKAAFDSKNGSFGGAPKFPSPAKLDFLLRYWRNIGDPKALMMVEMTLRKIWQGGIYDQIGFGIHRYATDAEWLVPHFEKMLYNQAMLASTCVEAYQAVGNDDFKILAEQIYTYVLRDMVSPEGGFYAAEDADSEGGEGRFYVWSMQELQGILDDAELKIAEKAWSIRGDGNYLDEATKFKTGLNIPHMTKSWSCLASELEMELSEFIASVEKVREKLFNAREKRPHPLKDTKVLADWNGLMIASLAYAARVFDSNEYLAAAEKAADFVLNEMTGKDGRMFHRWRESHLAYDGQLDDYAFMIQAFLELYESSFKLAYLKNALELNSILMEHFYDVENGGFYMTPDYGEELLIRPKEFFGGAAPAGNAVMIMNLIKLSGITGDSKLLDAARETVRSCAVMLNRSPSEFADVVSSLTMLAGETCEIVIAGKHEDAETMRIIQAVKTLYLPGRTVLLRTPAVESELAQIAPFSKDQVMIDDKPTVHICRNGSCEKPLVGLDEVLSHQLFRS